MVLTDESIYITFKTGYILNLMYRYAQIGVTLYINVCFCTFFILVLQKEESRKSVLT